MSMHNENASPIVQNNILMTRADSGSYCIYEAGAAPQKLQNNAFYNCATLYYDTETGCDGSNDCNTIDQVNVLADIPGGVSGNIAVDPVFASINGADGDINTIVDNDWHFSNS